MCNGFFVAAPVSESRQIELATWLWQNPEHQHAEYTIYGRGHPRAQTFHHLGNPELPFKRTTSDRVEPAGPKAIKVVKEQPRLLHQKACKNYALMDGKSIHTHPT